MEKKKRIIIGLCSICIESFTVVALAIIIEVLVFAPMVRKQASHEARKVATEVTDSLLTNFFD